MDTNDSLTSKFSNASAGGLIGIGAYLSSMAQTTDNIIIGGGLALVGASSLIINHAIDKSNYKPGVAFASVALVGALTFGNDEVARENFICNLTGNCMEQNIDKNSKIPLNIKPL